MGDYRDVLLKLHSPYMSDKLREKGNQLYREKKYFAAIVQYNQALSASRDDDSRKSLCFANRSAVYLKLEYFQHCIHNIDLAMPNYPADKIDKLKDRRKKCRAMMKTNVDKAMKVFKHEFKLSYEPNPKLPFFIDALELREDSTYGNHLITTRDLKAGDVIAVIDKPWRQPAFRISQNNMMACYTCADTNNGDLIPGKCQGELVLRGI
jgi:tetratricopeptide (TPR) repeat protein